jgi:hemerythrin-like domain-containing protein
MENQKQNLLDSVSMVSFIIGLLNLEENLTQGDKQDLMEDFNDKAELLLKEIHAHLEKQDNKLDEIIKRLEVLENGRNDNDS